MIEITQAESSALFAAIAWVKQQHGVRYAEARFVGERSENLKVRDGRPENASSRTTRGAGVRVLTGTWGFACTAKLDDASVMGAMKMALAVARASSGLVKAPAPFPERPPSRGAYENKPEIDPFSVPLEQKLADLDAPVREARRGGKPVDSAEAWMSWTQQHKRLVSTEGTDTDQRLVFGGVGMHVFASEGAISQRRSYPSWQGCEGFQGGYEHVRALDMLGAAPRLREEVIALLSAPPCPSGARDLVLESSQVALQIHESCGHPTELDRALGTEISLAGGSFMQPSMLGKLRYGSPIVNLVADSTSPGGMGTFGWDDEGVPAGKRALVSEGMFVDYLSSRETAAALGRESTGTMRADGWNKTPLIRMVNVSLEPGHGSLDDLIGDVKDGVYMEVDKSWSIDDLRLNFQFSCELAWEIKNGKRTRLLRDPFYTGTTPAFWRSCDAIAGPDEWRLWGVNSCGKGDPMQLMQVGHGASPARFRGVSIGNTGHA